MTNVIAPSPQNVKAENRDVKKDNIFNLDNTNSVSVNEKGEKPKNSFLSIMQKQIDELNQKTTKPKNREISEKSEIGEIKSEANSNFLKILEPKVEAKETEKVKNNLNINNSLNSNSNSIENKTNQINLALLGKNRLKREVKTEESLGELKGSSKIEDLIKVANEKGLNVKKLEISKTNIKELNEKQNLLKFSNLQKLEEKKSLLENKNLLVMENLKDENIKSKDVVIKEDSMLSNLLRGNLKVDSQKDSFANGFSLESLLQKEENIIGKKVKRDKFSIQTLKPDKTPEQIEAKKEITLDLKLDGNQKTTEVEVRNKMVDAKATINHFSNNLKEKMQEYKAPLMKMELTLNPKELGNVDVTLITRGNSVHINLASNSQAMQLFAQNAGEFKNALANIGFDNVEMNFNSNQNPQDGSQNPQDGQQQQKVFKYYADNNSNFSLEELKELEHLSSIDLIIPNYA